MVLDAFCDCVTFVDWPALSERLCWRVFDNDRELDFKRNSARLDCYDAGRHRGDLGGSLHALDVAARRVWQGHQFRECETERSECTRAWASGTAARANAFHGSLSAPVSR